MDCQEIKKSCALQEFLYKNWAYFDIMWPNWPINTHFCQGFSNWVVSWGLFWMWNSLAVVDPWKQRDFDNWLIVSLVPVTLCFVARSRLLLLTNITYKNCRVSSSFLTEYIGVHKYLSKCFFSSKMAISLRVWQLCDFDNGTSGMNECRKSIPTRELLQENHSLMFWLSNQYNTNLMIIQSSD